MAQKKEVKMQDLKPKKDAKGGRGLQQNAGREMGGRGSRQENTNRGQANVNRGGLM